MRTKIQKVPETLRELQAVFSDSRMVKTALSQLAKQAVRLSDKLPGAHIAITADLAGGEGRLVRVVARQQAVRFFETVDLLVQGSHLQYGVMTEETFDAGVPYLVQRIEPQLPPNSDMVKLVFEHGQCTVCSAEDFEIVWRTSDGRWTDMKGG